MSFFFRDGKLERFSKQGYLHTKKVLTTKECYQLLSSMILDWKRNEHSKFVWEPEYRFHCPMTITDFTSSILKKVLSTYTTVLSQFWNEDPWMLEFSSLCSFSGAVEQPSHPDVEVGKSVSIFVNLFDVNKKGGPLRVYPGSHIDSDFGIPPRFMTGPGGSTVLMDSRLTHGASAVISKSHFRPVFYASFGRIDTVGLENSILPSDSKKYRLSDFLK